MSFFNNFVYEPETPHFQCDEGENRMRIEGVERGRSSGGAEMLTVYVHVEHSNNELFKIFLVEGPYFNKSFSRFLDCFGITVYETQNFSAWKGKEGLAKFDHYKYNAQTKKTEQVAELQYHLIRKQGFEQPTQEQAQQPVQVGAVNRAFNY